jgi:LysR family transcriptional regulator, low CO2-responsive transcriptional regulator
MDLSDLEAFVEFSKTMNFTRAAEALHISQPALHTKVQKLSKEIGVPLYSKSGRVLSLTGYGVEVARFGRETSSHIEGFLQTLVGGRGDQSVTLAAGAGCYLYILGEPLRIFQERAKSGLQLLTTNADQTLEKLRRGEAHLGVTVLETVPPDLSASQIYSAPGLLIVGKDHRLARRKKLSIAELQGIELIVPPLGRPHRETLARTFREHEVNWKVALEASGWELMTHFVNLGLGAAIINGCCRIPGTLKAIPIKEFPVVNYYLLTKRTLQLSTEQQRLFNLIKAGGADE